MATARGRNVPAGSQVLEGMELLRCGPVGQEKPGLLDAQGRIRDLSSQIRDVDAQSLAPATLARLWKDNGQLIYRATSAASSGSSEHPSMLSSSKTCSATA